MICCNFNGRIPGEAFVRGPVLETSLFYMGSLISVLASSYQTQNGFTLLEYRSHPGNEPPPHVHIDADELLYVLDGEIEAYCQSKVLPVRAGECLFLPRNQAHAWFVLSPQLHALILTQPGGIDGYFRAMASPATSMELPDRAITYAMDDPQHAIRVALRHGIRILDPEEAKRLLPHYPGFGLAAAERPDKAAV